MEEEVHIEYAGGESIDADDVDWFLSSPEPHENRQILYIHSSSNIKQDSPPTTSIDRAEEGSLEMTSPSTKSIVRCVNVAGVSMQDVDAVNKLLHCPAMKEKIMASSTLASLEMTTRDARRLIPSVFETSLKELGEDHYRSQESHYR
jgi:hypothetical protein